MGLIDKIKASYGRHLDSKLERLVIALEPEIRAIAREEAGILWDRREVMALNDPAEPLNAPVVHERIIIDHVGAGDSVQAEAMTNEGGSDVEAIDE